MGEHPTEDVLVALEHEWTQAIVENDMDKLERIVGQDMNGLDEPESEG